MKIIKHSQSNKPVTLREAMNRLFEESFWDPFGSMEFPFSGRMSQRLGNFFPNIDVSEDNQLVKIEANIPGYDPKNIEVEIDENTLTLKGKMDSQQMDEGKHYFIHERSSGEFYRQIHLPQNVDTSKAECRAKNGTLTINIPKTESKQKKSLKIQEE